MMDFQRVWSLCIYAIDECLEWLRLIFVRTGALPYFLGMFFVLCTVWFLLDPIFRRGGSDRAQRRIDSNASDTKRLGSGR